MPVFRSIPRLHNADVAEAEIKLGYSAWIEALYKRNILNQVKSRAKNFRLLQVAKRVVLAQIELDLNSDGLENLWVKAGTALAFTWTRLGAEKPIEFKDFTIDNWMGLQDAQVLVLLNGGYGKLSRTGNPPTATPFECASQAQPLLLGALAVAGDEADIRRQISAMHTLSDTRARAFSRWWPLLLNQDVNRLENCYFQP